MRNSKHWSLELKIFALNDKLVSFAREQARREQNAVNWDIYEAIMVSILRKRIIHNNALSGFSCPNLRSSLSWCPMAHSQTQNKLQNQTTFINKPCLIPRSRWKGIPVSSWLVDELILRNRRCTLPQLGTSEKENKVYLTEPFILTYFN